MILATHGIVGSQIGQVDSDYQAVLDYATTQGYTLPSASQKLLQEQLIKDLKTAGIWSKLDLFYLFATDGDRDFAAINWKDPNNYEITEVNSPTFTTNEGFESDGTSAYLDTNWNLSTNASNYQQNNAGIFIGCPKMDSTSQFNNRLTGVGGLGGNYNGIRVDVDGSSSNNRNWNNSLSSANSTYNIKVNNTIYFTNRTSSTDINTRNTDLSTSTTNSFTASLTSSAFPNETQILLMSNGGFLKIGNAIGIVGLGSNFSSSEMDDIETAWYTNYFTNI